jgi:glycosyltransferase involved in cell wall biosynthesis
MAAIQRQIQISKSISNDDYRVLVISRKGTHSRERMIQENINQSGTFEGIDYKYASGTPLYPENFILRNMMKVRGWCVEVALILYYGLTRKSTCAIVCTSSLSKLKYLRIATRLANIKLIYDYVEYFESVKDRSMKEISNKVSFDTLFYKYTDALIIISSFLVKYVNSMNANKPYLIIPPIIDFDKYSYIQNKPSDENYFLYCGSAYYPDVIEFIINAYRRSKSISQNVTLVLVVNGAQEVLSRIANSIKNDTSIKLLSKLSYEDLIGYYKNAKALLIPLQDNLQDKARFPFKISEYTAAGRPIITSDSGAVVEYFHDGVNALMAKTGDVNDFSEKLNFILNNPQQSEELGKRSFTLGQKSFNYKSYSSNLRSFISQQTKQ